MNKHHSGRPAPRKHGRNAKQRRDSTRPHHSDTPSANKLPHLKGLVPLSGLHAIDAVFRYNPSVVEAFYFNAAMATQVSDAAEFLSQSDKTALKVEDAQLAQLAGTPQHDGVVALTKRSPLKSISPKQAASFAKEGYPLLIIEGDLSQAEASALIRSAVYYGIANIIFADTALSQFNEGNAYRTARGGLDMAEPRKANDLPAFIKQLRSHYYLIGSHFEGEELIEYTALCPSDQLAKPLALVLSANDEGLHPEVQELCHSLVALPGSEALDRLGLPTEAALLLQKYIAEGI